VEQDAIAPDRARVAAKESKAKGRLVRCIFWVSLEIVEQGFGG